MCRNVVIKRFFVPSLFYPLFFCSVYVIRIGVPYLILLMPLLQVELRFACSAHWNSDMRFYYETGVHFSASLPAKTRDSTGAINALSESPRLLESVLSHNVDERTEMRAWQLRHSGRTGLRQMMRLHICANDNFLVGSNYTKTAVLRDNWNLTFKNWLLILTTLLTLVISILAICCFTAIGINQILYLLLLLFIIV